jgi:hypothetical protein
MKAFPNLQIVVSDMGNVRAVTQSDSGMDLRDYFAGQAMQALIQFEEKALPYQSRNTKDFDDRVSYQAYRYADAMMEERNK